MDAEAEYQIIVRGDISPRWSEWFDGFSLSSLRGPHGAPVTTLCGRVADQAALRGVLCRLWDLNLVIVSVARLEPETVTKATNGDA